MIRSGCSLSSGTSLSFRTLAVVLLGLILPAVQALAANEHVNGRWSVPFLMSDPVLSPNGPGEVAVHMVALRGRNDSTQVLYWNHGYSAKLMLNAIDGAAARHVDVPSGSPSDPAYVEIFCCGASTLPDGSAFVAGGTFNTGVPPIGTTYSATFDAKNYGSSTSGWTRRDNMPSGRYYPTCTTLGDGSVLVSNGVEYYYMVSYGGLGSDDLPRNTLHTLAVTSQTPVWAPATIRAGATPFYRAGHTATLMPDGQTVLLYGGRNELGVVQANTQFMYREDPSDSTQSWFLYTQVGREAPQVAEHSVVRNGSQVILFGGQGLNGNAQPDVYGLSYDPILVKWNWDRLTTSGAAPSARFGHTAVVDPGAPGQAAAMLVYGGRDGTGFGDNAVYALNLSTSAWSIVVPASADTNLAPRPRKGHAALFDGLERCGKRRMLVFGGLDAAGNPLNDTWSLERGASGSTYSWRKLNPASRPGARSGHATIYERQRDQMLVIGGDTNGAASGGETDEVWGLPLGTCQSGTDPSWSLLPASSPPGGRSGHAAAFVELPPSNNRIPERFTVSRAPGSQWDRLTWASKLMPTTYPFVFNLWNGKVFWAGANGPSWNPYGLDNASYLLIPDASATVRGWQRPGISNLGFWGGAAVLFDATHVLKCGGNENLLGAGDDSVSTYALNFAADGSTTGWQQVAQSSPMSHRRNHNVVVLPTGDVAVVGGGAPGFQAPAQVWSPVTQGWTAPLALELALRNYHSTAVLLPDGRVLSAGGGLLYGGQDATDAHTGDIYEPPYLFNPDDTPATRPPITGGPSAAGYGQIVTVCTSSASTIKSVGLIRPGAPTHGFDQNQRYVPLNFTSATNPARLFVTMPPNGNYAPPGDYYLFIVDATSTGTRAIPSVAKWVSVGPSAGQDLCDGVVPGAITNLGFYVDPVDCTVFHLTWTAPGDDGYLAASGPATQYELKVSSSSFSDWTAGTGTPFGLAPGAYGAAQTWQVGVGPGQTRYFGIKTKDDNGGWSLASNVIRIDGPHVPFSDCTGGGGTFSGGGGGGGGLRAQPGADATVLQSAASVGPSENTLFNGVAPGSRAADLMPPPGLAATAGGVYSVRIREAAGHIAALDRARLLAVDHSSTVRTFVVSGNPVLGSRVAPLRATDGAGNDVTAQVDGSSTSAFAGDSGAAVAVDLGAGTGATPAPVVVEASGVGGSSSGILLQVPDGAGGWQTVGRVHPRLYFGELAVDSVASSQVRLYFLGRHSVRFVGRVARSSELPTLQWAPMLSARDARSGDALATLSGADTSVTTLAGPDTLMLSFAVPPLTSGMVRECYLDVEATTLLAPNVSPTPLSGRAVGAAPTCFALWQSQPNPFRAATTFRFDLPVGAMVRLEVFDVQGRRLGVITNRYYPAGNQAISWERRDEAGGLVRPGVYLYRLTAGSFRAEKRLVVLP